jgi:uncharacterized protein YceH (UPF0502 family)
VRYRQVLNEALGLDARQCALLAVLLLRGPQTVGELRARTERMTVFDGLDEIDHELRFLAEVAEPLATSLGRRPGQKEERWATPLVAAATAGPTPAAAAESVGTQHYDNGLGDSPDAVHAQADPLGELRSEMAALRSEVGELRRDLDALRTSLGG